MSIKYIKKSIDQKTRSEDDEKVKKIASGLILLISLIIPIAAISAMIILGS